MTVAPLKEPDDRPLVGIVIVGVFCALQLLFGAIALNPATLGQPPLGPAGDIFRAFPALMPTQFLGATTSVFIALTMLVGSILSFLRHPKGNATVRFGAYAYIALAVAMAVLTYVILTNSANWSRIPAELRGGLIGGAVGGSAALLGLAGGALYLFRKSRWG